MLLARLSAVLALLIVTPCGRALAAPWKLAPSLQPSLSQASLQEKYPRIDHADDLQAVLQEIAHSYPMLSLQAKWQGSYWLIEGELGQLIKDVNIKVITNRLQQALKPLRKRFIGQVSSVEVREAIFSEVLASMQRAGYPRAVVQIQSKNLSRGLVYEISVDAGEACILKAVHLPFTLPKNISLPIKPGSLCDSEEITGRLDELEDKLQRLGYKDLVMQVLPLVYSDDKKQAEVFVSGALGRRTVYKVVDKAKQFLIGDLIEKNELADIDLHTASPEIISSEIIKFYNNRGYDDVEVTKVIKENLGNDTDRYTFYVNPGNLYIISNVKFAGNQFFSSEALSEILGMRGFWDVLMPLNREDLALGVQAILAQYQRNGFWDAKIQSPRITKDSFNAMAQVVIQIYEGKQRVFEKLVCKNNTILSTNQIAQMLDLEKGSVLDKESLLALEDKVRGQYLNLGYQYFEAQLNLISEENNQDIPTTIVLTVKEGARVKIGKVEIEGLVNTKKNVVEREIRFHEGDWYDPEVINRTRLALINLGIFSSVQIAPADRGDYFDKVNTLDMVVRVQEGNAGAVTFGPGYNFRRGVHYVGEFSYVNLGGTGRQMSLRASLSEEKSQAAISKEDDRHGKIFIGRKMSLGYVEPYLFSLPVDGHVAVSHQGTAEQIWQLSNNFDLSLAYKTRYFLEGSSLTPFYNYRYNKEEGSETQVANLVSTGNSTIGSMGLRYKVDRRDDISWPRSGGLFSAELAWARVYFGGEFKFFRWDTSYKHFIKVFDHSVWANSLSLAAYEGVERRGNKLGGVLPFSERLQAGGVTTVRGFEHKLGPYVINHHNEKETTGGTRRVVLKSEYKIKLSDKLATSVFLDSGNTFFSNEEIVKFRKNFEETGEGQSIEDNISYRFADLLSHPGYLYRRHFLSYGSSLIYITPLGPLNFFLSFPAYEPKSTRCELNSSYCFPRARTADRWYKKFQFDINIGTEF